MKTQKDKVYSFTHTKQRLIERHNITLSESEYDKLCQEFINKKVKIISTEKSNNQIVFEVLFKNKLIKFVWDTSSNKITTVL